MTLPTAAFTRRGRGGHGLPGARGTRPGRLGRVQREEGRYQDPLDREKIVTRKPPLPLPGLALLPQLLGRPPERRRPRTPALPSNFARAKEAGLGRRNPAPACAACGTRPAFSETRTAPLPPAPQSWAAALFSGSAARCAWAAAGAGLSAKRSAPRAPSSLGAAGRGSDVLYGFESVPG